MVRQSGLPKDLIVVTTNKSTTVESDLTHLQNAAARWKDFASAGRLTAQGKGKEIVKPVLVVQVRTVRRTH